MKMVDNYTLYRVCVCVEWLEKCLLTQVCVRSGYLKLQGICIYIYIVQYIVINYGHHIVQRFTTGLFAPVTPTPTPHPSSPNPCLCISF